MQPVLEGRDDPEVPATAADGPEEVLVLGFTGPHQLAIGRHDICGQQVVTGQSIGSVEPAKSAPHGEAGDPGHRHGAQWGCQIPGLRLVIELPQGQAGFGACRAAFGVDPDPLHGGEVEHDPAVTHRVSRDAVAAAPDRNHQVVFPSKGDAAGHIGLARAPDYG